MAITLERLAAGIKAANAKGDMETVKKLGAAYRQMQGPQAAPAPAAAEAGQPIPGGMSTFGEVSSNMEWAPGQQPKPTAADEALSFGRGMVDLPIIGPTLADWRRGLDANIASATGHGDADTLKQIYARNDEVLKAKTGGARFAGQLAGSTLALSGLGATATGGRLLGTVGSLPQRIAMGGVSGGALSGADTLARGGSLEDAGKSAAVGFGLGMILPSIGGVKNAGANKAAQRAAVSAAIKDAAPASELKSAASALFENSRAANAGVNADTFQNFAANLITKAGKADMDVDLDGQAVSVYRRMVEMAQEASDTGSISLSRLHNLRQLAQDVVVEAKKPRTKGFANDIVDGLDNLIAGLKPGQIAGEGGKQAANDLLAGISTWARAKKLALIEEAITSAQFQPSGVTNGLRLKFQAILRNPKTRNLFSKTELDEIKRVANGGLVDNVARLIGKFGFGLGNNGNNVVGGSIGLALGGVPGMVAGAGARKIAEKLTANAAERAAKVVASDVPAFTPKAMPQGMLPGALLPLQVTRKREPIQITVRGGANSGQ